MKVRARRRLTGDVRLLDLVLCEPFRKDVRHRLWRVGYREWEFGIVARHGSYMLPACTQISINENQEQHVRGLWAAPRRQACPARQERCLSRAYGPSGN
jgi:hypothetical protein